MNVTYSRPAIADLEDIVRYLTSNNPSAVERFHRRIAAITARLARHPFSAQEVAERRGVRRLPLVRFPYVIFYAVREDEIVVLRILHGARRNPWEFANNAD